MENSRIIKTLVQKLFPLILLFGFYLTLHGHLSPGGGFQGGVVIGTAIILLALCCGSKEVEKRFKSRYLSSLEKVAVLIFILLGLLGISFGYSFLSNFLPLGQKGCIASAGLMLPLNLVISIKVAAGIAIIFYALVKYRGEI
ncbi:MAG: MnhB domain-containing protein [Atribacterota bacterium]